MPLSALSAAAPALQAPRVLVADGDALTAALLRHRLEGDGWPVEVATDGAGAQAALAAGGIALAVLSTKLPGANGFELLRQVRQQPGPQPAIFLLSYSANEQDLARAFDLGADDFLTKPFSPVEFLARARRLLRPRPTLAA